MSGQTPQRVRPSRNASPSTKQGPMKATLPYSLMQGSPTRSNGRKGSPSSSPTSPWMSEGHNVKSRRSPVNRLSPERRSPGSPSSHKVERPKPVRGSPASSAGIRRAGSLDTITGQYLSSQWPKTDFFQHVSGIYMADKTTQTPEEWDDGEKDKKKKGHKRSSSLGNGDQLKELYKQRLQKSKMPNPRQSPIHGNHAALTNPPPILVSKPVPIPVTHIPKAAVPRVRGSVEGLNQEIERLVLKSQGFFIQGTDEEEKVQPAANAAQNQDTTPDGHRAPIAELLRAASGTRSVNTQTPSVVNENDSGNSSGGGSRSQSISPSFPIIPGQMDSSRPSSQNDSTENTSDGSKVDKVDLDPGSPDPQSKYAASPRPNKSYQFVREPPDGCEKVPLLDETRKAPPMPPMVKEPLLDPCKKFTLKVSDSSAFCPLKFPTAPEFAVISPVMSQNPLGTGIQSQ